MSRVNETDASLVKVLRFAFKHQQPSVARDRRLTERAAATAASLHDIMQ